MIAEAFSFLCQYRCKAALPILLKVHGEFHGDIEPYTRAVTIASIALCYSKTGKISSALDYYRMSIEQYQEIGVTTEITRIKACVADLLGSEGHHAEAKRRLILIALTYLQGAAKQKRATPEIARSVRTCLERLKQNPDAALLPPTVPK